MDSAKGSAIYRRIAEMTASCDMLIGFIVGDRMFVVLECIFKGEITDGALTHCLLAMKLGKQHVAPTEKVCGQIEIAEEKELTAADREALQVENEENRLGGVALEEICRSTIGKAVSLVKY